MTTPSTSLPAPPSTPVRSLPARHVWNFAALALAAGLALGYFFPVSSAPAPRPSSPAPAAAVPAAGLGNAHMPTAAEMKQTADQQAAPLLAKLKSDPNNATLLAQTAAVYHIDHQFQQAAVYYSKAVQLEPANLALRTKYASSLYRSGDVDGALGQLNAVLKTDPKNANALFDLGMIRLQGKADGKGALAAWQSLLKTNPQLSPDRKAVVLKLIADVMTTVGPQFSTAGASHP